MQSQFSKRHYEAVAEALQMAKRRSGDDANSKRMDAHNVGIAFVQNELIALFTVDNYAFKPERFRAACIPGANVRAKGY